MALTMERPAAFTFPAVPWGASMDTEAQAEATIRPKRSNLPDGEPDTVRDPFLASYLCPVEAQMREIFAALPAGRHSAESVTDLIERAMIDAWEHGHNEGHELGYEAALRDALVAASRQRTIPQAMIAWLTQAVAEFTARQP